MRNYRVETSSLAKARRVASVLQLVTKDSVPNAIIGVSEHSHDL